MGKHKPGVDRKLAYKLSKGLHNTLRAIFSNISSPKYSDRFDLWQLFEIEGNGGDKVNPGYVMKAAKRDKPPATWSLLIEIDGRAFIRKAPTFVSRNTKCEKFNLMEPDSIEKIVADYNEWVTENVKTTHRRPNHASKPKVR